MSTIETLEVWNMWNMFKVNIKTPERRHRCRPGIFIAYLKHISHLFLVLLLLLWTCKFLLTTVQKTFKLLNFWDFAMVGISSDQKRHQHFPHIFNFYFEIFLYRKGRSSSIFFLVFHCFNLALSIIKCAYILSR